LGIAQWWGAPVSLGAGGDRTPAGEPEDAAALLQWRNMHDRFAPLRNATATALLHGAGSTSGDLRRAVAAGSPPPELDTLVRKIRARAYTVTDQDVDALRARYSDDQLFEIIVAAAFGAAQDRLEAAQRALENI
jgi:hypothetical protein